MLHILDCTLRDGGYVNEWYFGHEIIKQIIKYLGKAHIDYIECGFLEDGIEDNTRSLFNEVSQINEVILPLYLKSYYVAMTRIHRLNIDTLKPYSGQGMKAIRVSYHKSERGDVRAYCNQIKEKGYQVFLQPIGTTSYSDLELLETIRMANDIQPEALYIVDTLGIMQYKELIRRVELVDSNLEASIKIGFHSHNNLQLSLAHAISLSESSIQRDIIVDASLYGMGRGAGNLNTELIAEYLNDYKQADYQIPELLEIIEKAIRPIRNKYIWGYDIKYFLTAKHKCHPNYGIQIGQDENKTYTEMNHLLEALPKGKRDIYHKELISQIEGR